MALGQNARSIILPSFWRNSRSLAEKILRIGKEQFAGTEVQKKTLLAAYS